MKTVTNNIKKLRNNIGISANDLAREIGSNANQVYVWENNILQPRPAYVYQMLEYFKCSYSDLFNLIES